MSHLVSKVSKTTLVLLILECSNMAGDEFCQTDVIA